MSPLERAEAASAALKVFPLPSAVLFPASALPLHIFEERYRQMVDDALQTDQVIAIAALQPGWEAGYYERPTLESICCAGVLSWHEALEDGRFNIVLHGAVRMRVLTELPTTHLYREVRAEPLLDPPYAGPEEEQVRQAVLELSARIPTQVGEKLLQGAMREKGGALADVIAATVVSDVGRRQQLLCELDPRRRLQAVLGELGALIARLAPRRPKGPLN